MTNDTKCKMQPSKAKVAVRNYGAVELITAVLMGLVLVALVLAALIAPSPAHAQTATPPTVQVMAADLPQDFGSRLDEAELSLMSFERLVNLGVEIVEVADYAHGPDSEPMMRLREAFPEIDFNRIDNVKIEFLSAR